MSLKRDESRFTANFGYEDDPEALVDTEVRDLLFGQPNQTVQEDANQIKFSEQEPLLVQLPGTLPFKDVKPHSSDSITEILNMFSDKIRHE